MQGGDDASCLLLLKWRGGLMQWWESEWSGLGGCGGGGVSIRPRPWGVGAGLGGWCGEGLGWAGGEGLGVGGWVGGIPLLGNKMISRFLIENAK